MASFSLRTTSVSVNQDAETAHATKLAADANIEALRAQLAEAERLGKQTDLADQKAQVKKKYYHAKKKAEADQKIADASQKIADALLAELSALEDGQEPPQPQELVEKSKTVAPELAYHQRSATNNVLRAVANDSPVPGLLSGGKITATFKGHGYNASNAFSWSLKNQSNEDVELIFPAGQIFVPENRGRVQNLVLREELKVNLSGGSEKSGTCYAFCGNSNFGSPSGGLPFTYMPFNINTGCLSSQDQLWSRLSELKLDSRVWSDLSSGEHRTLPPPTEQEQAEGNAMEREASEGVERELNDFDGGEGETKSGQSSDTMVRRILFCYFYFINFLFLFDKTKKKKNLKNYCMLCGINFIPEDDRKRLTFFFVPSLLVMLFRPLFLLFLRRRLPSQRRRRS